MEQSFKITSWIGFFFLLRCYKLLMDMIAMNVKEMKHLMPRETLSQSAHKSYSIVSGFFFFG